MSQESQAMWSAVADNARSLKIKHPSRWRCGFTLIELLVVTGIVALLISVLMPALSKAREAANLVRCAVNMRNIGSAMVQYSQDNRGYIPPAAIQFADQAPGHATIWTWDLWIKPYIGTPTSTAWQYSGADYISAPQLRCPDDNLDRVGSTAAPRSYAMVAAQPRYAQPALGYPTYPPTLGTGQTTSLWDGATLYGMPGCNGGFHPVHFTDVRAASETLLLVEQPNTGNWAGRGGYSGGVGGTWTNGAIPYPTGNCAARFPFEQQGLLAEPLHSGKWNYLFCDGHVQLLAPQETLKGAAAADGVWNGSGQYQWYQFPPLQVNYMWTLDPND